MSPRDNLYEWINSYLNGELSGGERLEFENRLQTDQEFAKTFEAQKIAYEIVVDKELLNLRAKIASDLSGNYPGKPGIQNWKYIVGGTILIAVVGIIYFLLQDPAKNALPEKNEKSVPAPDSVLSVPDTIANETYVAPDEEVSETVNADPLPPVVNKENTTCSDTMISFSCQARAACAQRNDGAIEIDINTIKSGEAPFMFSVRPDGAFQSEVTISHLKPGKYSLYVKDSEACLRKLNVKVEVPQINCDHMLK